MTERVTETRDATFLAAAANAERLQQPEGPKSGLWGFGLGSLGRPPLRSFQGRNLDTRGDLR